MNIKAARSLKQLLAQLGLHVRSTKFTIPLNLTDLRDMNPVYAAYRAAGRPVLFTVPMRRILTFGHTAFPADREGPNPFIRTLMAYDQGKCNSYDNSPLRRFYSSYKPESAQALLGVKSPSFPAFHTLPPSAAPKPWSDDNPFELGLRREKELKQENGEHSSPLKDLFGDPFFGPVSDDKGALEFKRLIKVHNSIRLHGFRTNPHGIDNITVTALISDDDWRVMISHSGQHRIASLSASGHEEAVVQLQPSLGLGGVIFRRHSGEWPTVVSQYFTNEEALAIFDRIFWGQQTEPAEAWNQLALRGFE